MKVAVTMYRARAQTWLVSVALIISGCGIETDPWKDARPDTAPASGIVTYEGEPLAGAVIVFQPTAPGGIGASALTDAEGRFELQTFPPEPGAVPGTYAVAVMKTEMPAAAATGSAGDPDPIHVVSVIPEKYAIPANSGLTAEVPDGGTDTLDFDLKN